MINRTLIPLARQSGRSFLVRASSSSPPARRLLGSAATSPKPLSEVDPEVFGLINDEYERQKYGIELIASEVALPRLPNFLAPRIRRKWRISFPRISHRGQCSRPWARS